MSLMRPVPVPYDALAWVKRPFAERARMVCEAWALQGYGTPPAIYLLHILKIAVYVGVWVVFCGFTPGMGGLATIADWALTPIAFQKAILWSMVFEGLGLGADDLGDSEVTHVGGQVTERPVRLVAGIQAITPSRLCGKRVPRTGDGDGRGPGGPGRAVWHHRLPGRRRNRKLGRSLHTGTARRPSRHRTAGLRQHDGSLVRDLPGQ